MFRACAVAVLTALALAGCSTSEAAAPPKAAAATPNLPCQLPYGTEVALVKPAPGSEAGTAGPIILVASRSLPRTVSLVATDRRGGVTGGVTLERITTPHAHAKPAPFPDAIYYRATGAGLRSHRHYTLALDDVAQNGCAPYAAMTGEARFST